MIRTITLLALLLCACDKGKAKAKSPPLPECVHAGCNNEKCIEKGALIDLDCGMGPIAECYGKAKCERQPTGQCDFTRTAELAQCLVEAKMHSKPDDELLDDGSNGNR